jgi:ABC-type amino acid transport substrate-binding protein/signal transduction histidine kinase
LFETSDLYDLKPPGYPPEDRPAKTKAGATAGLVLTETERAWLQAHPRLRVQNETGRPPLNFTEDNIPKGFSIDYIQLLAQKLQIDVDFVTGPTWEQFLDMLGRRDLDLMVNIVETPERDSFLAFTRPYAASTEVIIAPAAQNYPDLAALAGKRVAIVNGYHLQARDHGTPYHIQFVGCALSLDCLKMVEAGRADATIEAGANMQGLLARSGMAGLRIAASLPDALPLRLATPKGETILRDILQKAMDQVTPSEMAGLHHRWLDQPDTDPGSAPGSAPGSTDTHRLDVTPAEATWLSQHPILRIGSQTRNAPFDFSDNDDVRGAAVDYFRMLAQRLGVGVRFMTRPSPAALMALLRDHDVDLVLGATDRPDQHGYATLTMPYLHDFDLLVARKGSAVTRLDDATAGRVAAVEGSAAADALFRHYGELQPVMVPGDREAMSLVASGRADIAVSSFGIAQHLISTESAFASLFVSGAIGGREFERDTGFAVRSDWPVLAGLLDRAMAAGDKGDFAAISRRWLMDSGAIQARRALKLAPDEWTALDGLAALRVCAHPSLMPYESIDSDGRLIGANGEVLDLLAARLALAFRIVPTASWAASLDAFAHGDCDVLSLVTPADRLPAGTRLTTPHLSAPLAIAARTDAIAGNGIDRFAGMRVAIVTGAAHGDWLKSAYPALVVETDPDLATALRRVEAGSAAAVVDALPALARAIAEDGMTDIRIGGKLPRSWSAGLGVRGDRPALAGALDKAIAALAPAERAAVVSRWTAIRTVNRIDTRLIWELSAGGAVALCLFLVWNSKLAAFNKVIRRQKDRVDQLLDHADQGFLSFGTDMIVGSEYSRACEAMLGTRPAGKPIDALLLPGDDDARDLFRSVIARGVQQTDPVRRAAMMSLLPQDIRLKGKSLKAAYTLLGGGAVMLMLTDATEAAALAARLDRERKRLEMIVAAVTEGRDFADAAADFRALASLPAGRIAALGLPELYRRIHTFKGTFSQFGFHDLPAALHQVEERLKRRREGDGGAREATPREATWVGAFLAVDWIPLLDGELDIVRSVLGPDCLDQRGLLTLSETEAAAFETLARRLLNGEDPGSPDLRGGLQRMADLRKISLRQSLAGFGPLLRSLADRLDKDVAPLVIEGEDVRVDPDLHGPFLRSLGHVFRNAVDHGIESPDRRLAIGKDETGRITCRIAVEAGRLRLEISDDGRGIDRDGLRLRLGPLAQAMDDAELLAMIFADGISLSDSVTDISGRGIGLAAVRAEIERLGGDIAIRSAPGAGTSLIFTVPLSVTLATRRAA